MAYFARLIAGLLAASLIAALGRRARALSASGAVAAAMVGTAAVAAGWDWGALLIAFFLASSLLSRVRRRQKQEAAFGIVAKGDERDVVQVLANGGLFAATAVAFVAAPSPLWQAAGAGALAAATAATWAPAIGLLSPRPPRSIVTFRALPAGTSGGVTIQGLFGAILGAAFIEMVALLLHWPPAVVVAALVGGLAGSLVDSLAGALVQQRRWCPACGLSTERLTHSCGVPTKIVGGLAFLDNDGVNLLCTAAGAVVAFLLVGRV